MIGSTLGHFRITDKLGEGGMGEVYMATDTRLDRKVALKVLPEDVEGDPDRRDRLEAEARAASAIGLCWLSLHQSRLQNSTIHSAIRCRGEL